MQKETTSQFRRLAISKLHCYAFKGQTTSSSFMRFRPPPSKTNDKCYIPPNVSSVLHQTFTTQPLATYKFLFTFLYSRLQITLTFHLMFTCKSELRTIFYTNVMSSQIDIFYSDNVIEYIIFNVSNSDIMLGLQKIQIKMYFPLKFD